jgi:ectoine hydroxylase-related dioxygenase (phytanoyl-CoA dioxygenase family)
MGVDGARLYHDQALFKEPDGGFTPWHQDQGYWPLDTDKTVTMWMPLVDISAESGTMTFASGSHANGYLGDMPISNESETESDRFVTDQGYLLHTNGAMAAGDATFHMGWTLHRAPGNTTEAMRELMTIIFIADGLTIAEPKSDPQRSGLRIWFPGLKPGDLAVSEINPLVYSR